MRNIQALHRAMANAHLLLLWILQRYLYHTWMAWYCLLLFHSPRKRERDIPDPHVTPGTGHQRHGMCQVFQPFRREVVPVMALGCLFTMCLKISLFPQRYFWSRFVLIVFVHLFWISMQIALCFQDLAHTDVFWTSLVDLHLFIFLFVC